MHAGRDSCGHPLCVALVAVVLLGSGISASRETSTALAAPKRSDGERSSRNPALTLHIRLTVVSDLPPGVRSILTDEAEAIWRREGVDLEWFSSSSDRPRSGLVLAALVARLRTGAQQGEAWPVGRLLPDQSGDQIAIASVTAAQQVLATAGYGIEPDGLATRRLGLVLGRTVAHEIGHYLLGTRGHARRGLMRKQIDARDFADLRDGAFYLDSAASRWLRDALHRGAFSNTKLARFTY